MQNTIYSKYGWFNKIILFIIFEVNTGQKILHILQFLNIDIFNYFNNYKNMPSFYYKL